MPKDESISALTSSAGLTKVQGEKLKEGTRYCLRNHEDIPPEQLPEPSPDTLRRYACDFLSSKGFNAGQKYWISVNQNAKYDWRRHLDRIKLRDIVLHIMLNQQRNKRTRWLALEGFLAVEMPWKMTLSKMMETNPVEVWPTVIVYSETKAVQGPHLYGKLQSKAKAQISVLHERCLVVKEFRI